MIGAGASIVSSLIGSRKQTTSSHVDYKRLVRDAEAAGFNPLTALRNGGAAGYSVTTTPSLSAGQIAGTVAGGVGDFLQNFDPFEDKLREVQYETLQAQLANLHADTALKGRTNMMFDPPAVSGRRAVGGSVALSPKAAQTRIPTVETPTLTNPLPTNSGMLINPGFVDAEAWETRYGDIAQEVGGMINVGADVYENAKGAVKVRRLTQDESKKIEEQRKDSWWPTWWPTFDIRWR